MRTVTVSHNWYSFLQCSGIAVPTVFGVPSDISCWDWGRVCRAWSGLVGMKAELGHSLTPGSKLELGVFIGMYRWNTLFVQADLWTGGVILMGDAVGGV